MKRVLRVLVVAATLSAVIVAPAAATPKEPAGLQEQLDGIVAAGAGGELISTTKDLNRFVAALLDGRLVPTRLLDEMKTPGDERRKYGLGLAWLDTTCGIRLYGNDGDALAYQAWSYSTEDGRRQVTVALTPNHTADLDDAVEALLDKAVCI